MDCKFTFVTYMYCVQMFVSHFFLWLHIKISFSVKLSVIGAFGWMNACLKETNMTLIYVACIVFYETTHALMCYFAYK